MKNQIIKQAIGRIGELNAALTGGYIEEISQNSKEKSAIINELNLTLLTMFTYHLVHITTKQLASISPERVQAKTSLYNVSI